MQPASDTASASASAAGMPQPPAPALIVVGEAQAGRPRAAPDARWQAALPAARRVLAIGADALELAAGHRAAHPEARWWGVRLPQDTAADLNFAPADLEALLSLDALLGLARAEAPEAIDLIVLGAGWASLPQAAARLAELSRACTPEAQLLACIDNASAASHLERLLRADAAPSATGLARGGLPQVPATFYKLLLDAGWMPSLREHQPCEPASPKAARALRYVAEALGVGPGSVDVVHRMQRLVVEARRPFAQAPRQAGPALFSVVVPTTEETQLRDNVECSPGLQEVQAGVISVRQASSPADALAQARPHCQAPWVLLCHQDVYFPTGFGEQLNAVLAAIPEAERERSLIGFIGLGVDRSSHQPVPAGHVIDRLSRADHADSQAVLSIDELALVLSRDSLHRIDPSLGWHLWATDLCLTAIGEHRVFPRIVRLPLFHNSRTGWTLPPALLDSAQRLLDKHPGFVPIHTLCGTLDAAFLARHQKAAA